VTFSFVGRGVGQRDIAGVTGATLVVNMSNVGIVNPVERFESC